MSSLYVVWISVTTSRTVVFSLYSTRQPTCSVSCFLVHISKWFLCYMRYGSKNFSCSFIWVASPNIYVGSFITFAIWYCVSNLSWPSLPRTPCRRLGNQVFLKQRLLTQGAKWLTAATASFGTPICSHAHTCHQGCSCFILWTHTFSDPHLSSRVSYIESLLCKFAYQRIWELHDFAYCPVFQTTCYPRV